MVDTVILPSTRSSRQEIPWWTEHNITSHNFHQTAAPPTIIPPTQTLPTLALTLSSLPLALSSLPLSLLSSHLKTTNPPTHTNTTVLPLTVIPPTHVILECPCDVGPHLLQVPLPLSSLPLKHCHPSHSNTAIPPTQTLSSLPLT